MDMLTAVLLHQISPADIQARAFRMDTNYVDQVQEGDLINASIKGMLESLDPDSSYLSEEAFKESRADGKAEHRGMGAEMTVKNGFPTVISAVEDTPAWKAGLKPGDQIIKVDGKLTRNMSLNDLLKLIRGQDGASATLTVMREGFSGPREFKLIRSVASEKSVKHRTLGEHFGYIRITEFEQHTAGELDQSLKALNKAAKEGMVRGIVLDLRNDPGGLPEQAMEVADRFLANGAIAYLQGRDGERKTFFAHERQNDFLGPLVVLVNRGSAGSVEIVAGAFQDAKRAVVVGAKTFGKGSVQTVLPLDDGSAVKLTTARYYTPKGRNLQADGITPDILVGDDLAHRQGEDRAESIKEKDLPGHLTGQKQAKSPGGAAQEIGNDADDIQLQMAFEIVKNWEALRGK